MFDYHYHITIGYHDNRLITTIAQLYSYPMVFNIGKVPCAHQSSTVVIPTWEAAWSASTM